MIGVDGKINDQPISILIDPGASHSYIDPNMNKAWEILASSVGYKSEKKNQ
jgi:hypothetical protein